MDKTEFFESMRQRGMRIAGNTAFGVEGSYPVMVAWLGKNAVSLIIGIDAADWRAHSKEIKTGLKEQGVPANAALNNGRLLVTLNTKKLDDLYAGGVQAVTRILKNCGISIKDVCSVCKGTGCDIAAPVRGANRPAHRKCIEGLISSAKTKAEENEQNGSYITGIIGALLGTVVGVIPSFFTIIFMERIFALLFALIPFCAYHGYRLLKGRMNKVVLAVSIIMGIVGVYVLQFALLGYSLVNDYYMSVGEMFSFMPVILGDISVWGEITTGSLTEFIFVALGIFFVWGQISRTSTSDVTNAETMLGVATPYGRSANVSDLYPDGYFNEDANKDE